MAVKIHHFLLVTVIMCAVFVVVPAKGENSGFVEIPAETLIDKIRGGLLGQMLGNLNGLEHEMKYINTPGNVEVYIPSLPQGAWTDDDTDLEWVYIYIMQHEDEIFLSPQRITKLWKSRVNKRIWCSNLYARQLMDIGIEPPLTGTFALNPWADFNISGQFICETFGLLAPAMPQTAARIGLNYTRVTIDAEPAQTTQFFTTMIATAFTSDDMAEILDAGVAALDPNSIIREIVGDVRRWHRQYPDDWRKTRQLVRDKYTRHGGTMRDMNGHELNTASIVAALLYGGGDFARTLMTAFNFGWDADCNAATAGTIVGVIRGYRWMMAQGWQIVDRYKNTTREEMPQDETITSYADRLVELAERVITGQGGQRVVVNGRVVYRIRSQKPANVLRLSKRTGQAKELREKMKAEIEAGIAGGTIAEEKARAAYLATCLDLAEMFSRKYPDKWAEAVEALNNQWKVVQVLYHHSPLPAADRLRAKADAAGLKKPAEKKELW
ncbi:MAG: ADP-ribosylglycohydrolase family protein [Planctomycetota bacterium]|nr:MAG: ADP-ribosylglycohydrolase family protein [Planctomycetota bacterium]